MRKRQHSEAMIYITIFPINVPIEGIKNIRNIFKAGIIIQSTIMRLACDIKQWNVEPWINFQIA